MKNISNVIKTAETLAQFRRRDKFGKFLPGLKKVNKGKYRLDMTKKIKYCEDGCVNLVTGMMVNISKNIKTPNRVVSVSYKKNIINYLSDLMQWVEIDTLWIPSWCEIYDFDEVRVKTALINKIKNRLKDYED